MANASSSDILGAQVGVYRDLEGPSWLDGKVGGTLTVTPRNRPWIDLLEERGDLTVLTGSPEDGASVRVELAPLRGQQAFFARDLDALLDAHDFRLDPPAAFFLAADDYCNLDGTAAPRAVGLYLETCRFARILAESADYVDGETEQNFIYLQKEKFELPLVYTAADLKPLPGLQDLLAALADDLHRDQKRTIVAAVTVEMLKPLNRAVRFAFLLGQFEDWLQRFKDGYRLYVSEFSFQKVKEDVEAHRLEYTARLNKVISDIQGQLLAIPVSLLIVATQMKRDGSALFNDSLIVAGGLIFALLMNFLLRNQRYTLDVIHEEIRRQRHLMREKYAAVSDRFDAVFELLARRYRHQKAILYTIDVLVILSLTATVVVYLSGNRAALGF